MRARGPARVCHCWRERARREHARVAGTYKGPLRVAGREERRGHGARRPQAAPRDPAARGPAGLRGALTLPCPLHLLLSPQAILAPQWGQILKARDWPRGRGCTSRMGGLLGLQVPARFGMKKHSGTDAAGRQGGAAGRRGWGLLFREGDLRKPQLPYAGRDWTLFRLCPDAPLPASLDTALTRGPSPPAPPAGLSSCPQFALRPLLRASAGTAGASARSGGCLGSSVKQDPKGGRSGSRPFSHLAWRRHCHLHLSLQKQLCSTRSLSHLGLPVGSTDFCLDQH